MTDDKAERMRAYKKKYRAKNKDAILAQQRARRAARVTELIEPVFLAVKDRVAIVTEACRYIDRSNLDQFTKYRAVMAAVRALEMGDEFWVDVASSGRSTPQWVNRFIKAAM